VLAQTVSTPAGAASSSGSTAPSSSVPAAASGSGSSSAIASASSVVTAAVSGSAVAVSASASAPNTAAAAPVVQSTTSWSIAQPLSTPSTGIQIPPLPSAADIIQQPKTLYLAGICVLLAIAV
jgi:hypothetical protein